MAHRQRNSLPPKDGIEFDSLPWNLNHPEEHTYLHLTTSGEWTKEHYDPETDEGKLFDSVIKYDDTPLSLSCACAALNYGLTIWEGELSDRRSIRMLFVFVHIVHNLNDQRF